MQLLDLLPLQLAASPGSVNGLGTPRLVAAGFTLLQRSASLVRALSGKRSAILLPDGAQLVTALAASDGRGALLLNPNANPAAIAAQLSAANVGAVFTVESLQPSVPRGTTCVLLDDVPTSARVVLSDREPQRIHSDPQRIDLGSHFGLQLTGEAEADGRDEECLAVYAGAGTEDPVLTAYTHRDLIARARAVAAGAQLKGGDHKLARGTIWEIDALIKEFFAPLIGGAHISTQSDA